MDDSEQTSEIQSPLQRVVVVACFASVASLLVFYGATRPVVELLGVRWAELVVYAFVPISVIFIILYRSCWHREITGAARTCILLLFSGVILGGELIAMGFMLCLALFCLNAICGGNH